MSCDGSGIGNISPHDRIILRAQLMPEVSIAAFTLPVLFNYFRLGIRGDHMTNVQWPMGPNPD
jgi:hypothetical protein